MSDYSIRVVGCELGSRDKKQLDLQGFSLLAEDCSRPAWLTLVGLTECAPEQVAERLGAVSGEMKVALVEPEQSELASAALSAGAQDYLLLPLDVEQLHRLITRLISIESSRQELVAVSAASRQLLMLAHRASATEASVLLSGESGTGKEQLARYIHRHSSRADKPFIAVNCAAIPESMLESVLFGHSKGAFTGAHADKAGKFELANGGTLLLDEIGEMPLMLQAKLLRVLQEREVERLGCHRSVTLDIRIIAASNKDLRKAVNESQFREDLFYRLDVLPLALPPLRERKDDILPLAEHLLLRHQNLAGSDRCYFSESARAALLAHDWPGNVRELDNCVQRALVMRRGCSLQALELGLPQQALTAVASAGTGLKASKQQAEFQFIIDTLKRFGGHRSRSAETLGMTTRALRYKMAQMREAGIDVDAILKSADCAA
ncbi:DNA-binding transcriptional response regulator, NtrC family, contains REC, AAA-type ATPase, and a Fis-type DNA-binding domains [Ferrimonas sediminum]|uniref:DNA-binding transcriptional response regulator, NtrC family, contains REC, AAA-type ATPase, and a Fis-type DNA-binding domains n=1 Tax=Ferrimonas sediminum TaxID=718193 RepID=A0A1G8ZW52_9GAMM|nr:sigma-54 dependent transcriptional regulator [Ferrimonas sediminum]SDK19283.1 DNA-binding transcriptional response regulator, NtrC family, contains REC, AAA-type ATPase, and a Fis-type DNA-binding domains [Ferrimonas sediminum]